MNKSLIVAMTFVAVAAVSTSAAPDGKYIFVDLGPYTNMRRADNFGSGRAGNDLKSLGKDRRTCAGINFKLAEGVLQLDSKHLANRKPTKIEGIKVGRAFKKLHILQACGYNAEEGTVIGKYVLHYDDKTKAEIDIVFGQDVVDWWAYPDRKGPTKSKIAWESENEASKGFEAKIRLYHTTWENPHPKKKVVTIDFVTTAADTVQAAPFCVAL